MSSDRTPWTPSECGECGKPFGKRSVYIWNGKPGEESAFVCPECKEPPTAAVPVYGRCDRCGKGK
jgi:DNA-directed RNA polymerase subunit RPC12/RpoP